MVTYFFMIPILKQHKLKCEETDEQIRIEQEKLDKLIKFRDEPLLF